MTAPAWRWIREALAPSHGVRGGALAFAAAAAAAAAACWGLATGMPFVAIVTFATQVLAARASPAGQEHPVARIGAAFVAGGMWAAIGMLSAGR